VPSSFAENNMPSSSVGKAKRRKLPLKISRLFEHGQNTTLDITSPPPNCFVLVPFKSNSFYFYFVDLSFPLVIFFHSLSLQALSFLLAPHCIITNIIIIIIINQDESQCISAPSSL
jgi:hypothetical protein